VDGKNVKWISFSFDTKRESWINILNKERFEWPQVSNLKSNREDSTFKAFQLRWIPAFFVIDPEGTIVGSAITANGLRHVIENMGDFGIKN
ncbi:MAG: thioredoxin family protein, partial [Bacteroidaceae bacterium]|nr:thioredoxin family protein [Bacteroidaceae bacterium]